MCKQTRPPRGRKTTLEEAPRIATIHEYLDWTVTAEDALGEHDLVLPRISYLILLPVHHDPQRQSHSFGRRLREGCKFQTYSEMQKCKFCCQTYQYAMAMLSMLQQLICPHFLTETLGCIKVKLPGRDGEHWRPLM